MPRLDLYHETVKRALIKDGWSITREQLLIKYQGVHVFIDLAAEKSAIGEKDDSKIAIEIKVFNKSPFVSDFEKAIGQYSFYRFLLKKVKINRELFLAVSEKAFQEFFSLPAIQEYISEHQIYLLVFDPEIEEVRKWIK